MTAKQTARLGVLTAAALVLGYAESLLPAVPVPGIKLGLSNIVLIYAVFILDKRCAVLLMLLKVGLSAMLFSGLAAGVYSLAGGAFSLAAMYVAKDAAHAGKVGVSVCGAVFHNIGQLAAACLAIPLRAVAAYLPVLLISGLIMGMLTGICAKTVLSSDMFSAKKRQHS